jgi:hypothetical protein
VVCDVFIDNEIFLMIDFVNLKIKSVQSFYCVYRDACVHRINAHIYMSIYVCTVFLKRDINGVHSGGVQ